MLPLADAVSGARGVAETGLAVRRPSAAAPTATRDLNPGELRMVYPLMAGWSSSSAAYAPCRVLRSDERRWPAAISPLLSVRAGISGDGVHRIAANPAGGGLRRGWKELEIDKTAGAAGHFA